MNFLTDSSSYKTFQSYSVLAINTFNRYYADHPYWVLFNLIAISFLTLYTINAAYPIPPVPTVDKVPPTVGSSIAKMATLSTDVKAKITEAPQLDPPKDTPFTPAELKFYDGQVEGEKIYVAIKGIVFDVSAKGQMYGKGAGYNIFAGKDASRGLGKSSLKPEDAVADYSTLTESELGVLEDWLKYFTKRYNIVGKVVA